MRDKMSAIEFATQTSGRQRTRWIGLEKPMQFSHQNSLIIKPRTRRDEKYSTTEQHARERKRILYECVVVLSRRTISILVYTERSSLS